jgi:acetate kinase
MTDAVLVLNAGSSSLKFSVFSVAGEELALAAKGQIEGLSTAPRFTAQDSRGAAIGEETWPEGTKLGHDGALDYLANFLRAKFAGYRPIGFGHRVVHGGTEYAGPVRVDAEVLAALEELIPLAPLHQPHNLAPIRSAMDRMPEVPQVACFDTSFHCTCPEVSQLYALPLEYAEAGVRRYGFHGLSYEYIASVFPRFDRRAAGGRTVVLHLGNGASMCAMNAGKSVAHTMGLTGVDGLPMGTRSGCLDPGVLLYLMDQGKMGAREIEELIYSRSGLLGVSGLSSDIRVLLASGDARARLALQVFVYRIGRELGSLAAALGGLDALVFTAGIGEHASSIRERVCRDASWLGVELDERANAAHGPGITTTGSRVSAWVIPTNEELMIARHTRDLLG